MLKKTLWKDIFKSFSKSKGRFFSILCLMLLGSFALVGLKVTGPNMRVTGENYFNKLNTADITIIGDYGLDDDDVKVINQTKDAKFIEYGYLKDVVIKDTKTSFRIFSKSDDVSNYEITEGRLPDKDTEIAIANSYSDTYDIGDTIAFTESEDLAGETVLKKRTFKIVGFIRSSEFLSSINLGQTTVGTGELNGYAVVSKDVFNSDYYMLARLTFNDTKSLDPYSDAYIDAVQSHKDGLTELLKEQPKKRLNTIKDTYQKEIDDGKREITDAKQEISDTKKKLADAQQQLNNGSIEIDENEELLNNEVAGAQSEITDGEKQLKSARNEIDLAKTQLADAQKKLLNGQTTLSEKWTQLQEAKQQLSSAKETLNHAQEQLNMGAELISEGKQQITSGYKQLAENQALLSQGEQQIYLAEHQIANTQVELEEAQSQYNEKKATFDHAIKEYEDVQAHIRSSQTGIDEKSTQLESTKVEYENALAQLNQALSEMNQLLDNPKLNESEKNQLEQQKILIAQQINDVHSEYNIFITTIYDPGKQQLAQAQQELDAKNTELTHVHIALQQGEKELASANEQLENGKAQLGSAKQQLQQKKDEWESGKQQLASAQQQLTDAEQILSEKEEEYAHSLEEYNKGVYTYNENQQLYDAGLSEWSLGVKTLDEKSSEYQEIVAHLESAETELSQKQSELATAKDKLAIQKAEGDQKLLDVKESLRNKEQEYELQKQEFDEKLPAAEQEIAENEEKLRDAQEALDQLKAPVYSIYSRRETPGSDGYKIYSSVSRIVDALANVFPIFLYLVAALVTSTTMSRFVDEERTNSGTLKALGYTDRDILKKFIIYGFTSSMIGTIIGIVLGHTLLPLIVYNAYSTGFTVPKIELHFHLGITLIALLLALISAVLPAWLTASKELKERPALLLQQKAPVEGSKILLERIPFIWNRMNFTQKVTFRNLFRYKKRMLMTIFGVCGSVTLLFAGLSVQESVNGISERQFGDIIKYDLIVAENDNLKTNQQNELRQALNNKDIKQHTPIYYEEMTTVAGNNKDTQSITLIVTDKTSEFNDYIQLEKRSNQKKINLSNNGIVISERLADLLNVGVGDTITLDDSEKKSHEFKVDAITEMYLSHFIFMNKESYETYFDDDFSTNGELVSLNENTVSNTQKHAAKFTELSGVKGVVQNTTLTNQIHTIVTSLNQIMTILIIVAALLAVVILYNLTIINVSERMRELSTIKVLGFYDKEVTLYIYRKTILLTIIGLFVGFGFGRLLHYYIITVVPPDDVMFNPSLAVTSFIIPTIIILLVTVLLGLFVNNRLRNVDMLEALKSVD